MKVSVLMCVRNVENYIRSCIQSILNQSFDNFELVIVDDMSTDKTPELIQKFSDERIKFYRNEKWLGISPSRNKSVQHATGDYLFFTDGDCTVSPHWIEEGLKYFQDPQTVGVEGKIIYVSPDYEPTFSDGVQENRKGGNYMTGNIAYRREIVEAVGRFDERLSYLEDRDIGLRVLKLGKIRFAPEMIVIHPKVTLTPKRYIKSSLNNVNRVYMFKRSGIKDFFVWRVYCPINIAKILFPPLIFGVIFSKKIKSSNDYRLIPYSYVILVLERIQLWKTSIAERIFLI